DNDGASSRTKQVERFLLDFAVRVARRCDLERHVRSALIKLNVGNHPFSSDKGQIRRADSVRLLRNAKAGFGDVHTPETSLFHVRDQTSRNSCSYMSVVLTSRRHFPQLPSNELVAVSVTRKSKQLVRSHQSADGHGFILRRTNPTCS